MLPIALRRAIPLLLFVACDPTDRAAEAGRDSADDTTDIAETGDDTATTRSADSGDTACGDPGVALLPDPLQTSLGERDCEEPRWVSIDPDSTDRLVTSLEHCELGNLLRVYALPGLEPVLEAYAGTAASSEFLYTATGSGRIAVNYNERVEVLDAEDGTLEWGLTGEITFGRELAFAGPLLLAGERGAEDYAGRLYAFDALPATAEPNAVATHSGAVAGDNLGENVTPVGDVDADGLSDIVVTMGAAHLLVRGDDLMVDEGVTNAAFLLAYTTLRSQAGPAGDTDGDGRDEFVVGDFSEDVTGRISVFGDGGTGVIAQFVDLRGDSLDWGSGTRSIGDNDGDGLPELLLAGFPQDPLYYANELWLAEGPYCGTMDIASSAAPVPFDADTSTAHLLYTGQGTAAFLAADLHRNEDGYDNWFQVLQWSSP